MATDQLITVESDGGCILYGDKESLECHHYRIKNPLCFGSFGSSAWPCKGQHVVLVSKMEYLTWKLTR